MRIKITVKRQAGPDADPYLQTFAYEGDGGLTVSDWLIEINRTEAKGDRIAWECGCQEKKCGACAMRINGVPRLACSVFLRDAAKHGKLLLEPFSKFPLVKDLVVDRSALFGMLQEMKLWVEAKEASPFDQDPDLQYQAGRCLQCGCCLEVCPNFLAGGTFGGAASMTAAFRTIEQHESDDHRSEMIAAYRTHFFSGCGQSLSCVAVCPLKLPLDQIQARANGHKR